MQGFQVSSLIHLPLGLCGDLLVHSFTAVVKPDTCSYGAKAEQTGEEECVQGSTWREGAVRKKKCMVFPSAKANESPGRLLFHLPICVLMDLNSLHTVHHVFADQSLECVHLSVKINPFCPLLFGESHMVGISSLIENNSSNQGLQTPRLAV